MTPSNPVQLRPQTHPLTPSTPSIRDGVGVGGSTAPCPLDGLLPFVVSPKTSGEIHGLTTKRPARRTGKPT